MELDNDGSRGSTVPEGTLIFPAILSSNSDGRPRLALQTSAAGERVAVAYTSVEALAASFGGGQPWIAIHHRNVPDALEGSGAVGVLVDVPIVKIIDPGDISHDSMPGKQE